MTIEEQQKVKNKIKEELKLFTLSFPQIFSDKTIDLFFKTLFFELNDPLLKLDGIQTRLPNSIKKVLLENLTKNDLLSYFPDFVKVEPFLKKVLYLIQPSALLNLQSQKKGLASFINTLELNPNALKFHAETIESVRSLPDFAEHILRVYNLRNIESHNCESWSKKEIYENIESVLVIYVYATYKHENQLQSIVNQKPDFTAYLNQVVFDFERWQKRFVHMTGKETFEEIDLFALESDEWADSSNSILREGKIDDLRKNIDESTMIVLGEPGMGKSTTLQYMAYNDAKAILLYDSNSETKIPIYIELKLLSKDESITYCCKNKVGLSEEKMQEYFMQGKVILFLDGLNEVLSEMRKSVRFDIQNLISRYPNLHIIITSRPLAYTNEFKNSPVFVLQRMENTQVEEFLKKNCSHLLTISIILNELSVNPRFGKIIRVPLLLKMLINVVHINRGNIPNNKVQIIKQFIQNLYTREAKKSSMGIDLRSIHRMLCFLGYKTREKNGSNVGCLIEEFEAILEERIEKSRFNFSVFEFFDFAIDLNIIVKDGNKFSFIHELYQEYYASEELYRISAKQK